MKQDPEERMIDHLLDALGWAMHGDLVDMGITPAPRHEGVVGADPEAHVIAHIVSAEDAAELAEITLPNRDEFEGAEAWLLASFERLGIDWHTR